MPKPVAPMLLTNSVTRILHDEFSLTIANQRQLQALIDGCLTIAREFNRPHRPAVAGMGLKAWLQSDEVGISSLFLAHVLAKEAGLEEVTPFPGRPFCANLHYPHDAQDFKKCVGLLVAVPEMWAKRGAITTQGEYWPEIAKSWTAIKTAIDADNWNEANILLTEAVERGQARLNKQRALPKEKAK